MNKPECYGNRDCFLLEQAALNDCETCGVHKDCRTEGLKSINAAMVKTPEPAATSKVDFNNNFEGLNAKATLILRAVRVLLAVANAENGRSLEVENLIEDIDIVLENEPE